MKSGSLFDRLVEQKDDFHTHRWRCVRYPDRAAETLGPYAQLDITIASARRLNAWTPKHTFQAPSSPYVRVFLNDKKAFETSSMRSTTPHWAHNGSLGVTVPMSMVRLQVLDYDSITHTEEIGFVEFCVGDLPWGKQIEGWFELRLHDMLERTSRDRYLSHSTGRDDEVDERHEVRQSLLVNASCMSSCNRGPPQVQRNAGELFVRLRLQLSGTWLDSAYALALDPLPPKNFGVKAIRKQATGAALPLLDVQELRDDITDFKLTVVDGAFASTANFIGYILQWRSSLLSTTIAAALIATWLLPALTWVVLPALLALLLVLLSSERVRAATTIGGVNAPLSQEGFESVARWRSKAPMVRFLRRVVEQDLQGKVSDEAALSTCAATVFSNGVPKITYQQLRDGLRDAKWTTATKDELAPGALVVVDSEDGPRRGKVQKVSSTGDVDVKCDDGPELSVRSFRVTPRPLMPSVPTWLIPTDLGTQIRAMEMQVNEAKKSFMRPVQKITQVLTWRWPCVSFSITLILLAISAAEALILLGIWGDLPGVIGNEIVYLAGVTMDIVKAVFRFVVLVAGVLLLLYRAPLLIEFRSLAKICLRLLTMRRHAPQRWPFFRETKGMMALP